MLDFKNAEQFKELCGYDINGEWYPRVTKIVDIKSKPALYYFYASLKNYAEGERIKKISAEEGTLIHETVQDMLIGKSPGIHHSIEPSIKAFSQFTMTNKIQIDPESVEKRVAHHKYKYAGTVDGVALIGGKLGVLDIKTSQAVYRDYRLQTSAYVASLKDDIPNLETRWILRIDQHHICRVCGAKLRKKGGREKVKIDWGNSFMRACRHDWGELEGDVELQEFSLWEDDFKAFLGAKQLWEWENEKWLKEINYI